MSWNFLCADMFPYEDSKTVSVCLSIWLYPEKRNHPGFVNISPKLIIDTSMEWSSRVLHHENPKIRIYFQKSSEFKFWLVTKSWNHLSFVYISPTLEMINQWKGLHDYRTLAWKPKTLIFFLQKSSKLNFDLCWRAGITLASSISVLHL